MTDQVTLAPRTLQGEPFRTSEGARSLRSAGQTEQIPDWPYYAFYGNAVNTILKFVFVA